MLGRVDEQIVAEGRAAALDPLLVVNHYNHAQALMGAQRFEDALAAIDRALAISPAYPIALRIKLEILKGLGRTDGIEQVREQCDATVSEPSAPDDHDYREFCFLLADIYSAQVGGNHDGARQLVDQFAIENGNDGSTKLTFLAMLYGVVGDFDEAGRYLLETDERAFFTRYPLYFPTDGDILEKFPVYARYWSQPSQQRLMNARAASGSAPRD